MIWGFGCAVSRLIYCVSLEGRIPDSIAFKLRIFQGSNFGSSGSSNWYALDSEVYGSRGLHAPTEDVWVTPSHHFSAEDACSQVLPKSVMTC